MGQYFFYLTYLLILDIYSIVLTYPEFKLYLPSFPYSLFSNFNEELPFPLRAFPVYQLF